MTASPVRAAASPVTQVPRTLSFLPGTNDSFSMELLSHYLAATTISMANGSTVQNPFSEQLIPMAFKSDLVLQLLLAQSAVHRAAKSLNDFDSVANTYYDRSLRLFQQNLSKFMGEQSREQTLLLGIAALILCFIEVSTSQLLSLCYHDMFHRVRMVSDSRNRQLKAISTARLTTISSQRSRSSYPHSPSSSPFQSP